MKVPRDLTGRELAGALRRLGYEVTRQSGSHLRLTTEREGTHHLSIPNHSPLKIGTLAAVLGQVEAHFRLTRNELLDRLFE